VIFALHTFRTSRTVRLADAARSIGSRLRSPRSQVGVRSFSTETALLRAVVHDMGGALSCLQSALGHLRDDVPIGPELLELAQTQAEHLVSMLRTVDATAGDGGRPVRSRLLRDVVAASVAASGLARAQLTVDVEPCAGEVAVDDVGLQRILSNLLENARRHGCGAATVLEVSSRNGWVELALTQTGVPAALVLAHLHTRRPPRDLTGLGLWSVQHQVRELGGQVTAEDDGSAVTLRVLLPDH
jgi:signal transduction histidine kinase